MTRSKQQLAAIWARLKSGDRGLQAKVAAGAAVTAGAGLLAWKLPKSQAVMRRIAARLGLISGGATGATLLGGLRARVEAGKAKVQEHAGEVKTGAGKWADLATRGARAFPVEVAAHRVAGAGGSMLEAYLHDRIRHHSTELEQLSAQKIGAGQQVAGNVLGRALRAAHGKISTGPVDVKDRMVEGQIVDLIGGVPAYDQLNQKRPLRNIQKQARITAAAQELFKRTIQKKGALGALADGPSWEDLRKVAEENGLSDNEVQAARGYTIGLIYSHRQAEE